MDTNNVAHKLKQAGIELFEERSGFPLNQAQRNLERKCNYAEEASLRNNVTKIHNVYVLEDGLVLGLIESVQSGASADSGRVYRPVFFDVFGNIIHQPKIDESFPSIKKAQSEFWKQAEEIDAIEATSKGIKTKLEAMEEELDEFKRMTKDIK